MRSVMVAMTIAAGSAAMAAPIAYPPAPRGDVVDNAHGVSVPDPYRWLEGDVRTTPAVRQWVDAQNAVTQAYLATLPKRDAIKARLTQLWDYEKFQVPMQAGGRLFYRHNTGLQNQFVLMVEDRPGAAARVLIDPNGWSRDGATALAEWEPSGDGRYVAYTVQDGGTDWRTVKVLDVASGRVLPETLEWAKFTQLAWDGKGEGFFYSRHPVNPKGRDFVSAVYDHMVYYHRVGTEQSVDRLVFRTPDHLNYYNNATASADGRWLILFSSRGSDDRYEVRAIDLARPNPSPIVLAQGLDNNWTFAGARGNELYFVTNKGAPLYRVVAFDIAHEGSVREVVPQGKSRIEEAALVGDRLVVARLVDAKSALTAYGLNGGAGTQIALPGIGSTSGLRETRADERTLFYGFGSFATPATVYAWDAGTGATRIVHAPKTPFDPAAYEVREAFYPSKDGTRVPMFIARKAGTRGPAPTMLYGYGGFNINIVPGFSPGTVAWMEMGGVYAQPSIRGGGEYGTPWHEAGKLFHKQNVFDDFIAAGEWLKREQRGEQARDPGRFQRWSPGGRGDEPAAGPVRRRAPGGWRHGHDAFPFVHRGAHLDRRLRRSERSCRAPVQPDLFALSQHPQRRGLSRDHGGDGGYGRPRRPRPFVQIHRRAPGGRDRRQATPDPRRDARRPRIGQTNRQGDRGTRGRVGLRGLLDGADAVAAARKPAATFTRVPTFAMA